MVESDFIFTDDSTTRVVVVLRSVGNADAIILELRAEALGVQSAVRLNATLANSLKKKYIDFTLKLPREARGVSREAQKEDM